MATIIAILFVAAAVGAALYRIYRNKKSGKSTCGSSCTGCPMQNSCRQDPSKHFR